MPKGEHNNHDLTGLEADRQERIEDKRILQKQFVDDLIQQWKDTTPANPTAWLGVMGTLDKYHIPIGTLSNWYNDNDFTQLWSEYKEVRATVLKDKLFNGMLSGVGANVSAFIMGILNKLDNEFKSSDNMAVNIQFTGGIRSANYHNGIGTAQHNIDTHTN
jgi:hypothetical protein